MTYDYRNFQQKSRRFKSGKGHRKQSNYHVKGKHSIQHKNKYLILRGGKRSDPRNYINNKTQNNCKHPHCKNDAWCNRTYDKTKTYPCQHMIKWQHHSEMEKSKKRSQSLKQQIVQEFDFDIDSAFMKVGITRTSSLCRQLAKGQLQPHSYNPIKNGKHKRILQIKRFNAHVQKNKGYNCSYNNLLKLIDKIGENTFFYAICKQFLYPWEIVNLFLLCKKVHFLITSYDKKYLYFQKLFLQEKNMQKYLLTIENMINSLQNDMIDCLSCRCDASFWTDVKKCLHCKLFGIEFEAPSYEPHVQTPSDTYICYSDLLLSYDPCFFWQIWSRSDRIMGTKCNKVIFERECNEYFWWREQDEINRYRWRQLCTKHSNDRKYLLKLIGFMAVRRVYCRIQHLIMEKKNVIFAISAKRNSKNLFESIFMNLKTIIKLLKCAMIIPHCNTIHLYQGIYDILLMSKPNFSHNIDNVTLLNLSIDN